MSEKSVDDWLYSVYTHLNQNKLLEVLKVSNRVFVCEESTVFLSHEETLQIILKRTEANQKMDQHFEDRERMTTVLLANAEGTLAPPLVISKSQRLSKLLKDSVPVGWEVARSETGWATSDNLLNYVVKVFYPWLMSQSITLPIVLFIEASTSVTSSLSEFCQKYGVIIVALYPPNGLAQPLDVKFYNILKHEWSLVVRNSNCPKGIKKEDFCPLFKKVLDGIDNRNLISQGFKRSRLFPFECPEERQVVKKAARIVKITEAERKKKINVLRSVEELIEDKVEVFERCSGQWNGPVEDTSLFELWSRLKREAGEMTLDDSDVVFVKVESD